MDMQCEVSNVNLPAVGGAGAGASTSISKNTILCLYHGNNSGVIRSQKWSRIEDVVVVMITRNKGFIVHSGAANCVCS